MAEKRVWSKYQQDVFADMRDGSGHTVVIACAGSGKSSTLIEGLKYIPKKVNGRPTKTLVVAFSKSIADEMREKVASYIDCRTLHSLGFAAIRNAFGKAVYLDNDKVFKIIEPLLLEQGIKKQQKNGFETIMSLQRTTSLCKGYLVDTPTKIDELMDRFDIDTFLLSRDSYIKTICQVLRKCKENKTCIDYDDMVYFCSCFNLAVGKWDRVLIDETQDLNASQIHMALSACKTDGRILAVGDPRQALFSFRGADSNAVKNVIEKLNAKVLPLSITYRCPKSVVKLAQEIVPTIEAAPNAKEGSIQTVSEKNFLTLVKPGDFVLSRLNAPLIYHCLALLRRGTPANIKGRDVGANLAYMIKKSEAETVPDFMKWLDKWKAAEIDRLQAKGRDPILILDKVACLETLCEGESSMKSVLSNIKELFSDGDDDSRAILSTVHRAKGHERDRVFLLMKTFKRGADIENDNIVYVAFTRSRDALFLVQK